MPSVPRTSQGPVNLRRLVALRNEYDRPPERAKSQADLRSILMSGRLPLAFGHAPSPPAGDRLAAARQILTGLHASARSPAEAVDLQTVLALLDPL